MIEKRLAETKQGIVRGYAGRNPSITVFKGVPYAQPPVGENRWREPKEAISWKGIREATKDETLPTDSADFHKDFMDWCGKYSEDYKEAFVRNLEQNSFEVISNAFMYARTKTWASWRKEKFNLKTWHYVFGRPAKIFGKTLGAIHSSELPFVFNSFDLVQKSLPIDYDADDLELSRIMSGYWVNFFKTLDPNGQGLLYWNEKDSDEMHMYLDKICEMQADDYKNEYKDACIIVKKVFKDLAKEDSHN